MKPTAVTLIFAIGTLVGSTTARSQSPFSSVNRPAEVAPLSGTLPEPRVASQHPWGSTARAALPYGHLWQDYQNPTDDWTYWSQSPLQKSPPRRPILTFFCNCADRVCCLFKAPWIHTTDSPAQLLVANAANHDPQYGCGSDLVPASPIPLLAPQIPTPSQQAWENAPVEKPQPLYVQPQLVAPPSPFEPPPVQVATPSPLPADADPPSPAATPTAPPAIVVPIQPKADVVETTPIPTPPAPAPIQIIIPKSGTELPVTPINPPEPAAPAGPIPLRQAPLIEVAPNVTLPSGSAKPTVPRNSIPLRNDKPPKNAIPAR